MQWRLALVPPHKHAVLAEVLVGALDERDAAAKL
jgi:hypothetical protein